MNNENLKWLIDWFQSNCDGDWEHENQIKIQTTSNPGWYIEISLIDTLYEDISMSIGTIEFDDDDWYFYNFKAGIFKAAGDLSKLEFLLMKFKETVQSHQS